MCRKYYSRNIENGLGKTTIPSVVSVVLTAARIPMVMILSSTFLGLNGIWWAISISSILKGIVIAICYVFVNRNLKQVGFKEFNLLFKFNKIDFFSIECSI